MFRNWAEDFGGIELAVEDLIRVQEEAVSATEKFQVELPQWTGPYDLLLKVIDEQNLNLLDLNIVILLQHYLEYLDQLDVVNLDEAGDFLVVGATLAQIKSKMLLPEEEREAEEEEEDPRAQLVHYLMEYQKIKKAAEELKERPLLGRDVFVKGMPELFQGAEGEGHGTLFQLVKGLQKALKRNLVDQKFEIEQEEVSVSERFQEVFKRIREENEASFDSFFPPNKGKSFLIATFLAVLELVRMKKIRILQRESHSDIFLIYQPGATSEDVIHSEFDEEQNANPMEIPQPSEYNQEVQK